MRDLSPRQFDVILPTPAWLASVLHGFLRKVASGEHGPTIIINPCPSIKSHFKTFYVTRGMIVNLSCSCRSEDWTVRNRRNFLLAVTSPYNFAMRNDVHAKAYLASRIDIEAGRVTWPETSKDLYARGTSEHQGGLWKPIGRRADRHSVSRGTPTSHANLLCSRIESQISRFASRGKKPAWLPNMF